MKRKLPSFHHDDIVQRQDHFLKVTEIAELVAARDGPHQDPVFLIIIKHGRERPEFVEDTLGDAEGVHGVGLAGQVFVFGHLKKVAQRMPQLGKTVMEIDQNDQRPDFRRITQPFPGFKVKKLQRVLPHPLKFSRAFVHRRVEDQRRIDQDLADDGHRVELFINRRWERDLFERGNRGHLRPCGHLPVNARVNAGDVFLDVAVHPAEQIRQLPDGRVKRPVGFLVPGLAVVVGDKEPVETAPIIINIFDEFVK